VSPEASWTLSPGAIALLVIVTGWYVHRWRAVGERPRKLVLFLAGILTTAAAIISPIDALGHQLFFMHMIQHLLLLDIAAILIILGLSRKILRPVTRRVMPVEVKAGFLATPVFAITLYVVVMWIWHIPALYDAALEHDGIHVLEHLAFAGAGGLYWWHIFSPIRPRHRLIGLGAAGYMASTKIFVGLLGVFLTFSPDSFYAFYEDQPRFYGLSPSEDQAIGGAIMTLEQMIVMGAAFAWLFIRMLGESEKAEVRAERYGAPAEPAAGPPVVAADFDPGAGRTPLSTAACRAELERLGITLHEGLRLRLQHDEREIDAVARWDADWGGYMAEYEPAGRGPRLAG
jgi:cytochrome c oxidase assembly factor CtaG